MIYIDIKYHFVRLEVQKGTAQLQYRRSDDKVADVFTKRVTRVKSKLLVFTGRSEAGGVSIAAWLGWASKVRADIPCHGHHVSALTKTYIQTVTHVIILV